MSGPLTSGAHTTSLRAPKTVALARAARAAAAAPTTTAVACYLRVAAAFELFAYNGKRGFKECFVLIVSKTLTDSQVAPYLQQKLRLISDRLHQLVGPERRVQHQHCCPILTGHACRLNSLHCGRQLGRVLRPTRIMGSQVGG